VKLERLQLAYVVEIKKPVIDKFSANFQKVYDRAKPVYMPVDLIFNKEVK